MSVADAFAEGLNSFDDITLLAVSYDSSKEMEYDSQHSEGRRRIADGY